MFDYNEIAAEAKVWIYQADRPLTEAEVSKAKEMLEAFVVQWTAHGKHLKAYAEVLYDRFIVLMADETAAQASGCSIDSSVRFLKELEKTLNIQLFERNHFAWKEADEVHAANREEFAKLRQEGKINSSTIVFNNLVHSKRDFETQWQIPYEQSWHKRLFG